MATDAMSHQYRRRDREGFDQGAEVVDGLVDVVQAAGTVRTGGAALVIGDRAMFEPKLGRLMLSHLASLGARRGKDDGLAIPKVLAVEACSRRDLVSRRSSFGVSVPVFAAADSGQTALFTIFDRQAPWWSAPEDAWARCFP